jgi:hypothetical protein
VAPETALPSFEKESPILRIYFRPQGTFPLEEFLFFVSGISGIFFTDVRGFSMKILISIDDTDNLESPGTGALASQIAADLESNGWGQSSFITRHQLLVHPTCSSFQRNTEAVITGGISSGCNKHVFEI